MKFREKENANGRVQKDDVTLAFDEECTQVLDILFRGTAKHKDIVRVDKAEISSIKLWKVWTAFNKSKNIKGIRKSQSM
jgi:hypothetical protein